MTTTSPAIVLAALVALAACSSQPDAKAATDSAAGSVNGSTTGATAAADSVASGTPASTTSEATGGDSARVAPGTLIAGRGKQDQRTFDTAIRAGTKALANWPKHAANAGALLPEKRIIAYYGNPNSKRMGVIGEYPEQQMLSMLDRTVAQWKSADPATPIVPAIHLVTVVAQGAPGADNMWRRREGSAMIERTYKWAQSRNGILFLDIQVGHSTLQQELPPLLPYLSRPDVHLGVDPEFHMHHAKAGVRPSAKIGQMKAADINYVIQTLDRLVTEKKLPPKVLVVHRFTAAMVPDAESIRPTKNVQVVMHMDGWGPPWLKFDSYHHYIVRHPVQYTGFKLFYHNDTKAGHPLLTPKELLQLKPTLNYIQYQ